MDGLDAALLSDDRTEAVKLPAPSVTASPSLPPEAPPVVASPGKTD
jgi:hypothetical protein